MKNKKRIILSISLVAATALCADEGYKLQEVTVSSQTEQAIGFETSSKDNINSQGFNKNSINIFGRQINTTPFHTLDMSPSVNFGGNDNFGVNENGFHEPVRVRGKSQTGPGAIITVEGIPVAGNPGGGKTIYDMENFSGIDLYKGYIPVDKGLGATNLVGKVDMIVDRPKNNFGATLSQMLGTDNAKRTFLRIDTGKLGDFSSFVSVSNTEGDKWKGEGEIKRVNGMAAIAYAPTDNFKAELFAVQNRDDHHNYYTLSYAQAKDLDANYDRDWSAARPTNANNPNYYDWNKQNFEDTVVFANIEYKPTHDSKITLKPYYARDNGEYWYVNSTATAASTRVMQWLIDHDLFGAVLKYEKEFSRGLNLKIGYWYGKQQPPGPPVSERKYTISASGNLVYNGWSKLNKNDYSVFNSPFVELSGEKGAWSYAAGVRYFSYKVGTLRSYTLNAQTAATSSNYDTAISNTAQDAMSSSSEKTMTEILPSMYISYKINSALETYFDYTRTTGFDVNLFPAYPTVKNGSGVTAKALGISFQTLWDKQKFEVSDNFDIGLKYTKNGINYAPNIFLTKIKNKQVQAYDESLGIKYNSLSADAMSYGAELAISGAATKNIDFMLSGAYNKYFYTQDLRTSATQVNSIKGNQTPDTPIYTAKGAVTYKLGGWSFTPSGRYIGSRYGNVDHTEEVPAYAILDFDISYKKPKLLGSKEGVITLALTNIFNRKYISTIITPDNALAVDGATTTYQTGAPFGAYLSANLKF